MGIEPTSEAWEASILPLYDARSIGLTARLYTGKSGSVQGVTLGPGNNRAGSVEKSAGGHTVHLTATHLA
jgi:hypothetical protein